MKRSLQLIAGLVAIVVAVLATGTPARAHGGEGELTLESTAAEGAGVVRYELELRFADDNHTANDATVTAVAVPNTGPGSEKVGPVQFDHVAEGRYVGRVAFPSKGEWNVRFTAIDPPASLQHAQPVVAPASADEVADEPTSAASGSDEADTTATSASPDGTRAPLVLGVAAAMGAILIVGVIIAQVRGRNRDSDTGADAADTPAREPEEIP